MARLSTMKGVASRNFGVFLLDFFSITPDATFILMQLFSFGELYQTSLRKNTFEAFFCVFSPHSPPVSWTMKTINFIKHQKDDGELCKNSYFCTLMVARREPLKFIIILRNCTIYCCLWTLEPRDDVFVSVPRKDSCSSWQNKVWRRGRSRIVARVQLHHLFLLVEYIRGLPQFFLWHMVTWKGVG